MNNKISVKDILGIIGTVALLAFIAYACISGLQTQENNDNTQKQKEDQFIKSCVDRGRRVTQIGDVFTGERLVCNPK